MKAIFIAYNQAYNQEIVELLEGLGQRGYTVWNEIGGRGSVDGEPHLGSHAWPTQNHALLTVVEDSLVAPVMAHLKDTDAANPNLGLRAYVLPVEQAI
jgi:nitrogen regulatory protein PII